MSLTKASPSELTTAAMIARHKLDQGEPLEWPAWQALGLFDQMRRRHWDLARSCGTENQQRTILARAVRARGHEWR